MAIEIDGLIVASGSCAGVFTVMPQLYSNPAAKKWYDMMVRKGIEAIARVYKSSVFAPDTNRTNLGTAIDYDVFITSPYKNREGYKPTELITSGKGLTGLVNYNLYFEVKAGLFIVIDSKVWTVTGITPIKNNTGIIYYTLEIES